MVGNFSNYPFTFILVSPFVSVCVKGGPESICAEFVNRVLFNSLWYFKQIFFSKIGDETGESWSFFYKMIAHFLTIKLRINFDESFYSLYDHLSKWNCDISVRYKRHEKWTILIIRK